MKTEMDSKAGLMRRYLLGQLAEAEQVALEQRFFADSEMLDHVWAIENELVDGYVCGSLPRTELEQFERHYLASRQHRERVAFAKELLQAAEKMVNEERAAHLPARAAVAAESFWEKLRAMVRTPQFALSAALFVALMLIGGAWLIRERARWRQQAEQHIALAQAERTIKEQRMRELENQIAQQRERNAQLGAELEQLRQEQRPATASAVAPSHSTIFSFLLLPSVRASSEQQTLKLPPGAGQVRQIRQIRQIRLQMKIERRDYQRYQASLRAVDGGESWPATSIKASTDKDGATISVLIPAAKLKRGDYILTLTGIDDAGTAEEIDRYFFRVDNK
ncbi:MAG: hypothetical protein M3X11_18005 [Acidobacteriota bacterium]|nr:hypothetical protein [Acidobacteriota bacterium]